MSSEETKCPYINDEGLCPTIVEENGKRIIKEWAPCDNRCME